jgi:hypothetical protein
MEKVAAVVIAKNSKNELLLLNRTFEPFGFCLPGGIVNLLKESIAQGCVREFREETGVMITESELDYIGIKYSEKGIPVHVYKCVLDIDSNITISDEHNGFIFVKSLDNIPLAGNTKLFLESHVFDFQKAKLSDKVKFGKYKGETFEWINNCDNRYLSWMIKNVKTIHFGDDIIKANKKRINDDLDLAWYGRKRVSHLESRADNSRDYGSDNPYPKNIRDTYEGFMDTDGLYGLDGTLDNGVDDEWDE